MSTKTAPTPLPRLPYSLHLATGIALGIWAVGLFPNRFFVELLSSPIGIGGIGVALLLAGWRLRVHSVPKPLVWMAFGLVLGTASHASFKANFYGPSSLFEILPSNEGDELEGEGCVVRGARRTRQGWRLTVGLDRIRLVENGWRETDSRVSLWWRDGFTLPDLGDCLHFSGSWSLPASPPHQLAWDSGAHSERSNTAAHVFLSETDTLSIIGESGGALIRGLAHIDRVRLRLERELDLVQDQRTAWWVRALGMGNRSGIWHDDRDLMTRSGLAHILAVSGLHLALFVLSLRRVMEWLFARLPFLTRRREAKFYGAIVTIPLCWGFVFFTGFGTAALRAALFLTFLSIADIIRRPRHAAGALGSAVAVLLLIQPMELFGASFQLSVAAVSAIAVAAPQGLTRAGGGERNTRFHRLRLALSSGARISLAVTLTTAPILAFHFGVVSISGIVLNVIIAPIMAIVLLAETGAVMLAVLLGHVLVAPLMALFDGSRSVFFAIIDPISLMTRDPIVVGRPFWFELVLATGLLVSLAAVRSTAVLRRRAIKGATVWGAVLVSLALFRLTPPASLEAWFLPVGQSEATLVRTPSGHTILVDTGGAVGDSDPARTTIIPLLRGLGVQSIDILVITHADYDHSGGFDSLTQAYVPEELWLTERAATNERLRPLVERLVELGTTLRIVGSSRSHFQLGEARIEIVHPLDSTGGSSCASLLENDCSIVMRITYENRILLLTGDIEAYAESLLVETYGSLLAADVLKAPHHGSRSSSTIGLLANVWPQYAVFSVGENNRHHLPHEEVVERYSQLGIHTYRTDTDLLVVVRISAEGIEVTTERAQSINYPFHL